MPNTNLMITQFIEVVKTHPVLYDMTHPEYKNIFLKNKLWEEIGEKLNITGNDAKTKWKNLRDSYGKYLKSTTGQSAAKTYDRYGKWQWSSSMEFLRDYIGFATTETNVTLDSVGISQNTEEPENDHDSFGSSDSTLPTPPPHSAPVKKRINRSADENINKVITYLNSRKKGMSSTEHIMLGYAKTIDTFSEKRKILIKMKIAQIVMENELEEQEERNRQGTPITSDHNTADSYIYVNTCWQPQRN